MTAQPAFGFVEWFRPGEHDRVLRAVEGMRAVGASSIRTHLSWATYHTPEGAAWYDWLIPTISRDLDLLPCVHYTPPSLSRTGRSSGPPRRLKDFPDFIDHVLTRYGSHFQHIELWNEPNNLLDWDWREDSDWLQFCEMIGAAAYWTRHRGWQPVLGGPCPFDPNLLHLFGQRGLLGTVSAVGFHAFPGTWDSEAGGWLGYNSHLATMRSVLDQYNPAAEIWITEAGYSTWRHDETTPGRSVPSGPGCSGRPLLLVLLAGHLSECSGAGRTVLRPQALPFGRNGRRGPAQNVASPVGECWPRYPSATRRIPPRRKSSVKLNPC